MKEQNPVPYEPKFSPVISELIRQLGMKGIIDEAIDCKMAVSPGLATTAMVLNTVSGRSPLYRVKDNYLNQDTETILGSDVPAEKLNDDTLGRTLDRIYDYGTGKLLTRISCELFKKYEIARTGIWHDTTSVSVWGNYQKKPGEPFEIKKGFSKDKRPDLKQFVLSLITTNGGFPLRFTCEDGNANDKNISNSVLKRVGDILKDYEFDEDYILVSDSALVTEENLALANDQNTQIPFVSRLPRTYKECQRVVEEAVDKNKWKYIGPLAQTHTTGEKHPSSYKIYDSSVELYENTYRAVVVHSNHLRKRKKKKVQKDLDKSLAKIKKTKRKIEKQEFYCKPDAETQLAAVKSSPYHRLEGKIVKQPKYGRGRPPKKGPHKPKSFRYQLKLEIKKETKAIKKAKVSAGCFVLLSNIKKKNKSGRVLLARYKEQNHIEQNFRFLKDPLLVNDLFLEKPSRIEALGLILILSLMLWRLVEYLLREKLKEDKEKVEGWNNLPTENPTAFMMATKFNVLVVKDGRGRQLGRPLNETQKKYLEKLDMDESIYLLPWGARKITAHYVDT